MLTSTGAGMKSKDDTRTKRQKGSVQHPLFGISMRDWIRLVRRNGGIDRQYLDKALFISMTSICTAPVRFLFKLKYHEKINKSTLNHPPVFIIGHWRSGTTYLHELLSKDPQFCYVSLWNTLLPDSGFILEPIKEFLSRFLPSERPMDAIKVDMDGPYEDEAALAVLYPWSFFHCLHFPRNAEEQYLKSIHFQGLSVEEKEEWKSAYLHFIKMVMFANKGKQLLSKNPPNTARIATLLELFPDAKFIHIYRSPYLVYLSTKKMRKNVLDKLALQNASQEDIEQQVVHNYIRLMTSYFDQKSLIKKDNLVEIKYEDLISDPLGQVKHIYTALKLKGFSAAEPEMRTYLNKQAEYKTNVYAIDKKIIHHVDEHWKFAIERWKYTPPK